MTEELARNTTIARETDSWGFAGTPIRVRLKILGNAGPRVRRAYDASMSGSTDEPNGGWSAAF